MTDDLTNIFNDPTFDDPATPSDFHNIDLDLYPHGDLPLQSHADLCSEPRIHVDDQFHATIDGSADDHWWNYQGDQPTCAIVAQQGVLESLVGRELPQDALIQFAYDHGWYDPLTGTSPECMGNIIEACGVPVERAWDCSITDIFNALLHDEKVIVGLNANEIWQPARDLDGNPIKQHLDGHAVWVTGAEIGDDGHPYLVLNDSAPKTGRHERVAVEDFLNAWSDFGNYAVITTHGLKLFQRHKHEHEPTTSGSNSASTRRCRASIP